MRGTGIYESRKNRDMSMSRESKQRHKRIGIGKCGSVEAKLLSTAGVNAILLLCGVGRIADYFFALVEATGLASGVLPEVVVAVAARGVAAREVDLKQSRAE